MSDSPSGFIDEFNKTIEECAVFTFATRDPSLQEQARNRLEEKLAETGAEKRKAVAAGDEDYANTLLGCECLAAAMISEIKMWLLVKNEEPDNAWDELINAQGYLADAIRAHEGFAHYKTHLRRLYAIEHIVFPPQVFFSSGMIVKSQLCSVCGKEYEDCTHIKNRPYMGQLCRVTLIPAKVDHVSIVTNPANKRCRVVSFSVEGGIRNRMTWRVEPSDRNLEENVETDEKLAVQGIIATLRPDQSDARGELIEEREVWQGGTPIYRSSGEM